MSLDLRRRFLLAVSVLLLVFIAWRVIGQGFADHFARTQPGRALAWRDDQPEALIGEAERLVGTGQSPAQAAELARRALRANPLEGRGYRVLGRLAEAEGKRAEAVRLFELAVQRSPRDLPSHAWLARHYLQTGQLPQALQHIDTRLQIQPQLAASEFPLLAVLAAQPAAQPALADLLGKAPPWREKFIAGLVKLAPDSGAIAPLMTRLRQSPPGLSPVELAAWLDRLVKDQRWGEAYLTWVSQLAPAQQQRLSNVFNGDFETEPTGMGFDWRMGEVSGAVIERLHPDVAADGYALRVSFEGRRVLFKHLRQLLNLAPGKYRLQGRVRPEDLRTERGLVWVLSCGEGGPPLATTEPIHGSSGWVEFDVPVTVPGDHCGGQWLQLKLPARIPAEQRIGGRVWFDDLRVVREH
ncbi:tetratricopeptide repeat protein [Arenimonas oryziterrae]|uniref:Uncharacterized protein n=1 Tax=Arenimonas oryziterrae DSM 21050 = YC6267 TaxID=1121015 RepID=A0A091BL80_9GAMM|nr:tetratricopeptide repeat protein [Arenimonas oryziterrae]KFN45090.1 hypothetical protein N789_03445 [Arenimonas oryziterrae DSM 21050 = YC6267]